MGALWGTPRPTTGWRAGPDQRSDPGRPRVAARGPVRTARPAVRPAHGHRADLPGLITRSNDLRGADSAAGAVDDHGVDPGEQAQSDERLQSATSGTAPRWWPTVTARHASVLDRGLSYRESSPR